MLFHPKRKILGIQGLLPKRKKILAQKIGDSTHLIMPHYFQKIEKIPIIGSKIMEAFKKSVEKQINSISDEELEKIIFQVMKHEMRFVIWAGGIIGFLIGIVQVFLVI